MEVKIKNNEELIDATVEMVDGVMVVSPKEVKFEPKDGDVVSIFNRAYGVWMPAIFCEAHNEICSVYCMVDAEDELSKNLCKVSTSYGIMPATEEEKKLLFDKLADEGLAWDSEKKELVKIKWKPSVGQHFYYPEFDEGTCMFIVKSYTYAFKEQIERDKSIAKGWCFKTAEDCISFCDKLNKAIESIKP